MKKIIFAHVGNGGSYENGSQTFFVSDSLSVMVDCNYSSDKNGNRISPMERIKKYARKTANGYTIDLAIFSHGDADHIGGFEDIEKELKSGKLIIKCLCHQGFDRVNNEGIELSEYPDYSAFVDELKRRENSKEETVILRSHMNETDLKVNLNGFKFEVLNPPIETDKKPTDVNDMSIVLLIDFGGKTTLLAGDTDCNTWLRMQEDKIINALLKRTEVNYFELPHHGSATFLANDRDSVISARKPEDLPNYKALDWVNPDKFVLSAETDFPGKDYSGDTPPHYATFKWLRYWLASKGRCSDDASKLADVLTTSEQDLIVNINESGGKVFDVPSYVKPYASIYE